MCPDQQERPRRDRSVPADQHVLPDGLLEQRDPGDQQQAQEAQVGPQEGGQGPGSRGEPTGTAKDVRRLRLEAVAHDNEPDRGRGRDSDPRKRGRGP